MLSILISEYPGNDIDVFLEPLVDDLYYLFERAVDTYDVSIKDNFNLRTVMLWTINDYPALGTLCGYPYSGFKETDKNTTNPQQVPPTRQASHTLSTIKLPVLKKGEYDIWAIKMEHYLEHTYYPIWEVIQKGNGHVQVSTDINGQIRVLPPKTAKEILARERERKARTTLLMAILEDQGLHKGYDRFQSLLSQLETHGVGVFTKDANQKFLRSLPSSWSQVSLIMRTKPGVDTFSFDDLYNNLRVFEFDVKGSTRSSSSTQNVAFVSSDSTNSTNEVNTAYGVSTSSVTHKRKALHHTRMI
nr:hypothetical protein [Tanacetum cinerariifolium]